MKYFHFQLSIVLIIYLILTCIIFNYIFAKQPTPFIDEVFHIPQGLKYCNGNFSEWDPKITTLPGLYLVSYGLLHVAEWMASSPMCNLYNLRFINVISSTAILFLLYSILAFDPPSERRKGISLNQNAFALWNAFNIAIFPVSFLFIFFYYTETLSTLFSLIMYHFHISKRFWSASVIGIFCVLIRQTNIVWVGYFLLIMECKTISLLKIRPVELLSPKKLQKALLTFKPFFLQLFYHGFGYILICCLFLLFVYVNGGIVIGDRSAHKPVLHVCQLFYFSFFTLFFSFPHFFNYTRSFIKLFTNNPKCSLVILLIGVFIVYNFTMVHPYLLADNRHYSFYVWRRLYEQYKISRYLLIPFYYFGIYCINSVLEGKTEFPYWLCCALCLIPQRLFDFRYFLLPYLFFRLQIKCKTWWILSMETLFFILINCLTIYIFVSKEFLWADSKDIQRIIW